MSREELEQQLMNSGFRKERFSEYHNNAFVNDTYKYKDSLISLEVFVDRYNVRIIWWHDKGKKVSKNYYINKEIVEFKDVEELINTFITKMISTYSCTLSKR